MNEKALIKKCQRGDRQAFDTLIRLYYDYVFGFLRKTTSDKALTEDLTQETFLKMIRSIEKFDPGGTQVLAHGSSRYTDRTAVTAKSHDIIVLERFDCIRIGKGHVLNFPLGKIEATYDAYICRRGIWGVFRRTKSATRAI